MVQHENTFDVEGNGYNMLDLFFNFGGIFLPNGLFFYSVRLLVCLPTRTIQIVTIFASLGLSTMKCSYPTDKDSFFFRQISFLTLLFSHLYLTFELNSHVIYAYNFLCRVAISLFFSLFYYKTSGFLNTTIGLFLLMGQVVWCWILSIHRNHNTLKIVSFIGSLSLPGHTWLFFSS